LLRAEKNNIKVALTNANLSLLSRIVFALGDPKVLATWNWKKFTVY